MLSNRVDMETSFQFIDKNLNLTQQSAHQQGVASVEGRGNKFELLFFIVTICPLVVATYRDVEAKEKLLPQAGLFVHILATNRSAGETWCFML